MDDVCGFHDVDGLGMATRTRRAKGAFRTKEMGDDCGLVGG